MLKVAGLSVAYGGLHALEDVSLEVVEGEFVTIVGPNGAGKTTLLKTIGGGTPATAGRIEYRGRDIGALPSHARARLGIAHPGPAPSATSPTGRSRASDVHPTHAV